MRLWQRLLDWWRPQQRSACRCQTCQSYCQSGLPGRFQPGEAERAAKLLDLPLSTFFRRYLTVERWPGEAAFVLRPRTIREVGGHERVLADPRGRCIFYDPTAGLCQIHAAKPYECAMTRHDLPLTPDWHAARNRAWLGAPQRQIQLLLGRPL